VRLRPAIATRYLEAFGGTCHGVAFARFEKRSTNAPAPDRLVYNECSDPRQVRATVNQGNEMEGRERANHVAFASDQGGIGIDHACEALTHLARRVWVAELREQRSDRRRVAHSRLTNLNRRIAHRAIDSSA
jgi:hypothetical protein